MWYFINISKDKNKYYNIINLFLGIIAIWIASGSLKLYTFVHRILNGQCNNDENQNENNNQINKPFKQVLYEKIIVPILPFLIILFVCILYSQNQWSFIFKIIFILVIALYITTSVYYPGFYGFICSIFIIFLICGKWSNIAQFLFGSLGFKSHLNKKCS